MTSVNLIKHDSHLNQSLSLSCAEAPKGSALKRTQSTVEIFMPDELPRFVKVTFHDASETDVPLYELKNKMVEHQKSITKIDLSQFPEITDLGFIRNCVNLQYLDISNTQVVHLGRIPVSNLVHLTANNCLELDNLDFLENATGLVSVSFNNCKNIKKLPLNNCGNLKFVDATNCVGINSLAGLDKCSSLETLNLTGCSDLSRSELKLLNNCKKLKTLTLPSFQK